ncbi:MAG: aldolase/citrate lyase family protein, partial [Clostridium sp.]|nr:aldolase/citrate lyase family protein [Clostridium sp.]
RRATPPARDTGADGLLVPMVNTAQEARQIVSYAKYPSLGHRGASTQRAHTNYDPPKLEEYFEIANAKTIILAQIETRQALENVDEIAGVEGLDAVVIGPNDLSIDLGVPGNFQSQSMKEAERIVVEAAQKAGKASGIITSKTDVIRECRDKGMTVLSCDSEVGMLLKMAKQIMSELT